MLSTQPVQNSVQIPLQVHSHHLKLSHCTLKGQLPKQLLQAFITGSTMVYDFNHSTIITVQCKSYAFELASLHFQHDDDCKQFQVCNTICLIISHMFWYHSMKELSL